MSFFRDALRMPDPDEPFTDEQHNLLDRLAIQVVKRGMTVPSIVFLESIKPLNFIASQTMVFFEPVIQAVFSFRDYETLRVTLERRESIELLLKKIEEKDALLLRRDRAIKKFVRKEKKTWKWYQRWLGIRRPRIELPDEIKNMPSGLERPNAPASDSGQQSPPTQPG